MSLPNFINKYKSDNISFITNIIIDNPNIYLNIPYNFYDKFLNLYSNSSLKILENPSNLRQLRIEKKNDISIDYYLNLLNNYLDIKPDANICYILENQIIFPYIFIKTEIIEKLKVLFKIIDIYKLFNNSDKVTYIYYYNNKKIIKIHYIASDKDYEEFIKLFSIYKKNITETYLFNNKLDEFDKLILKKQLLDCLSNKRKKNYTDISTLKALAKKDNPEKYKIIIDNLIYSNINSIFNNYITPYDIAKIIYNIYKYDYKINNRNIWYEFDINSYKWIKCDNKYKLRNELSEILSKYFTEKAIYYNKKYTKHLMNVKKLFMTKKQVQLLRFH